MFTNYIKQAKELNQIDLDGIRGRRLYYSKFKAWMLLIISALYLVLLFYSMTPISEDKQFLILIPGLLMFLYFMQKSIRRLLLKNPVMILNGDQLYYLKTNEWYSITDHTFDEKSRGGSHFILTYFMYDDNKKTIIEEDNWQLKDGEVFKKNVWYNRAMKLKEMYFNK